MPAKDRYHATVKRALIKDGWQIRREQINLIVEARQFQLDLCAFAEIEGSLTTIFVEIKSFLGHSPVEDLAAASGKYLLYRLALDESGQENTALYLAVPDTAYAAILTERIGTLARDRIAMKLLVFSTTQEEILEWIP